MNLITLTIKKFTNFLLYIVLYSILYILLYTIDPLLTDTHGNGSGSDNRKGWLKRAPIKIIKILGNHMNYI
jgi:hypothetical protein